MVCTACSEIQEAVEADALAKKPLPDCVDRFEDLGYFGDDLDGYHLKKCPACGSYFRQHDWDHFEEGGAVGTRVERVGKSEAAGMIPKILEKIQSAEWLQSKYDVVRLKAELKKLTSA